METVLHGRCQKVQVQTKVVYRRLTEFGPPMWLAEANCASSMSALPSPTVAQLCYSLRYKHMTICAIVLVNLFQLNTDIALAIVIDTLGDNIFFHMGHPGDEVLGLFGPMVYKNDKSFKIHPKTELTQVDLELKANQKDWNMDSSLKGLSLRILMSHKPDL